MQGPVRAVRVLPGGGVHSEGDEPAHGADDGHGDSLERILPRSPSGVCVRLRVRGCMGACVCGCVCACVCVCEQKCTAALGAQSALELTRHALGGCMEERMEGAQMHGGLVPTQRLVALTQGGTCVFVRTSLKG